MYFSVRLFLAGDAHTFLAWSALEAVAPGWFRRPRIEAADACMWVNLNKRTVEAWQYE